MGAGSHPIRLVATDLDGTLLHADGTVTARTREVLTEVEKLGVTVVFVTGRPVRWMEHLWEHVGGHGLAIVSNGAILYDVHQHAVRMARPIPRHTAVEVAQALRRAAPGTTFAAERVSGFAREEAFMPRVSPPEGTPVGPAEGFLDDHVVKLLARHEEAEPEEFWAQVESHVGHLVTTTWSSTGALVEMSAAGVSKASMLQIVCDDRGIEPTEVVAFGDMPNDLPLLEWAGTSYAMANAHPAVRELADHVAPSHEQDGVAQVLTEIFGL